MFYHRLCVKLCHVNSLRKCLSFIFCQRCDRFFRQNRRVRKFLKNCFPFFMKTCVSLSEMFWKAQCALYTKSAWIKYNLVSIWYLVRRGLGIRWSCQSFSPRWELRKENKKSRRDTTAHFWARKVKLNANANNKVGSLLMHNHVLEKNLIGLTFWENSDQNA